MLKRLDLGVIYKAHGHSSLASSFSGASFTHGFVISGIRAGTMWGMEPDITKPSYYPLQKGRPIEEAIYPHLIAKLNAMRAPCRVWTGHSEVELLSSAKGATYGRGDLDTAKPS